MKKAAVNTVEVLNIKKNIMGTISIVLKAKGMRKEQDFILYPITKESTSLKIQSATRMGNVNLEGKGLMTKSHANGAYFHHLAMDKLTPFEFSSKDWKQIVDYIGTTEGDTVGESIVKTDNSGARSIFNL